MTNPLIEVAAPLPRRRSRRSVWLVLKLLGTAAALWWAVSQTSFGEMARSVQRIAPLAFLSALSLLGLNLAVGALRWREVLRAYAIDPPPLRYLLHGYLVATFYNTFVPGNVGGDALRAYAVQSAFARPADSYLVIAIERGFGLAALLFLGGAGIAVSPVPFRWIGLVLMAAGLGSAVLSALTPWILGQIARFLPAGLRSYASRISIPGGRGALLSALAWSLLSQILGVLVSHVLVSDLCPEVRLVDSLAVVPLAMLSLYVPVSVSGLGIREAAFVALYARVGVSAADATAASLAFMATLMVVALVGGAVHLISPLAAPASPPPPAA
jgi:uncharacterized membrane protein YbhN (UPF0104 family)